MFHHTASGVNDQGRLALDAFKPLISDADGRLVNGSLSQIKKKKAVSPADLFERLLFNPSSNPLYSRISCPSQSRQVTTLLLSNARLTRRTSPTN